MACQRRMMFYASGQSKRWQYSSGPKIWYAIDGDAWDDVAVVLRGADHTSVLKPPVSGFVSTALGVVRMRGEFTANGGGGSLFTLFTLPSGLRPSQGLTANAAFSWGVLSSGVVQANLTNGAVFYFDFTEFSTQ